MFLDLETETGTRWPEYLESTLRRSKILVAVWTPPYFRSPWCLAEWDWMEARERESGAELQCSLVYPVIFSDSDRPVPAVSPAPDRRARSSRT